MNVSGRQLADRRCVGSKTVDTVATFGLDIHVLAAFGKVSSTYTGAEYSLQRYTLLCHLFLAAVDTPQAPRVVPQEAARAC
jgi:hypothetical protein